MAADLPAMDNDMLTPPGGQRPPPSNPTLPYPPSAAPFHRRYASTEPKFMTRARTKTGLLHVKHSGASLKIL
jgi:hypothetical protein